MRKSALLAAAFGLTTLLLAGPLTAQDKMQAVPAFDPSLLQPGPATQEECYRFGWRGWGKYKNCSCLKCSWKLTPTPHRFCWRVC